MTDFTVRTVAIESGVLGVGDPAVQPPDGMNPDDWVNHMKAGNAVCVATGGDGGFGVVIRITEDSFDLLPDEGTLISGLSAPVLLNVPGGKIVVSDMAELHEAAASADPFVYPVPPGIYECMIQLCENPDMDFFGFSVVLKKSSSPDAKNPTVREIEQLG